MRWNSVKKTAQWAVFRNSPEGFSLRGRGARSAARNPGGPAIFQQRKAYRFVTAVIEHVLCHHAFHLAFRPSACVPKYGASASRQYGTSAGFLPSGVRMWHLGNSPAQPFQKNSPKVGKCSGRRAGVPVIYSLALHAPCAVVAQLVEQLTRNEQVTGSSPVNGSMNSQRPASQRAFCFRLLYGSAILESPRPVRVSKEQCSSKVPCSVFCFAGSEDALIGCISDCLAPFVLWDRLDWFSRFASPPLSLLRSFEIQVPGRIFEPRVANLPFETLSGSNFANLVEMMPGQKLTVCKRPGQIGAEICPRRFVSAVLLRVRKRVPRDDFPASKC